MKKSFKARNSWVIQSNAPTLFHGNLVNVDDLYGVYNGVAFITEPRAFQTGIYPDMVVLSNGKWVKICPTKISAFLLDAIHGHCIHVWKIKTVAEREAEARKKREAESYHRAFDDNCNSCIRRFKGKGQGHCSTPVPLSEEYRIMSHEIYGGQIDMNGKIKFVDNKMAQYMDGNTTEGYRPLNPVFPVKSGKR